MDIRRVIEATIQVKEDELGNGMPPIEPQGAEPTPDVPAEIGAEETVLPEITPELAQQLAQEIGLDESIDMNEFMKGLTVELEHFDSVGGDMLTVAKIAADHIREHPGKSYYGALETMEVALAEEGIEAEVPAEVPGEAPVDVPMDAAPVEAPRLESKEEVVEEKVEEGDKEPEDTELEAAKRRDNQSKEEVINKKEIEKEQ